MDALVLALRYLTHGQQRSQQHEAERGYVGEPAIDLHAKQPIQRLDKQDDAQREDATHHQSRHQGHQKPLGEVPEGHIIVLAVEAQQKQRQHHCYHCGTHADHLLHREALKLGQIQRHAQP